MRGVCFQIMGLGESIAFIARGTDISYIERLLSLDLRAGYPIHSLVMQIPYRALYITFSKNVVGNKLYPEW